MRLRGMKLLALPGVLAFARSAFAQGCVLCYTSAANQPPRAIHALDQGIVILLIPPVFIFLGVFAFFLPPKKRLAQHGRCRGRIRNFRRRRVAPALTLPVAFRTPHALNALR